MKKILSLVLALLMTVSCASLVFASEDAAIADTATVTTTGKYDDAIIFLKDLGVYKGKDTTTFVPAAEDPIVRWQMAYFVARIATGWTDDDVWTGNWKETNPDYTGFTDIAGNAAVETAVGAISYAAENGIIIGYGDGRFGPEDGIIYQDALTMVVRTLGYKSVSGGYPWGFIEKAVQLGLTDGVEVQSWTTPLNRGEVAQILYNALLANDCELLLKNFADKVSYEESVNVVIVSANGITFETDDAKMTGTKISYKELDPATGKLGDDVYTIDTAKEAAIDDDDINVGEIYTVTYTDGRITAFEEFDSDVIWNYGRNDMNIADALDGYAVVDGYTDTAYKLGKYVGGDEIILYEAVPTAVPKKSSEGTLRKYALDYANGNILEFKGELGDHKIEADEVEVSGAALKNFKGIDEKKSYYYKVLWNWDAKHEIYFKWVKVKAGGTDSVYNDHVGIEVMSKSELAALLGSDIYWEYSVDPDYEFTLAKISNYEDTAYASLKAYDLDGDGKYDWGIIEKYKLGYYDKDGNVVTASTTYAAAYKTVTGNDISGLTAVSKDVIKSTTTYAPDGKTVGTPEKKNYVIYGFNPQNGELKVVKNISKLDEKDVDGIQTGVVRGYSVKDSKITIDSTTYKFDYASLLANNLVYKSATDITTIALNDYLGDVYGQFVKFVLVDGKVVDIAKETTGTSTGTILFDQLIGLADDGAAVILGYDTTNSKLEYKLFRIATYESWTTGAFPFYLSIPTTGEPALLKVTSYDKENDLYFVVDTAFTTTDVTIDGPIAGQPKVKFETLGTAATTEKKNLTSDVYYIIVSDAFVKAYNADPANTTDWTLGRVILASGQLKVGDKFVGKRVGDKDKSNVYYLDNYATDSITDNFAATKTANAKYVLFNGYDATITAFGGDLLYTGVQGGEGGYYSQKYNILGATMKTADVTEVLTNEKKTAITFNRKLQTGKIYKMYGDYIVDDEAVDITDLKDELINALNARYSLKKASPFKRDYLVTKDNAGKILFSKEVVSPAQYYGYNTFGDLVDSLTAYLITLDVKNNKLSIKVIPEGEDDYNKLMGKDKVIDYYWTIDKKAVTVYVFSDDIADIPVVPVTTTPTFKSDALDVNESYVEFEATFVDGVFTGAVKAVKVVRPHAYIGKQPVEIWTQTGDGVWEKSTEMRDAYDETNKWEGTAAPTVTYDETTATYTVVYVGEDGNSYTFTFKTADGKTVTDQSVVTLVPTT